MGDRRCGVYMRLHFHNVLAEVTVTSYFLLMRTFELSRGPCILLCKPLFFMVNTLSLVYYVVWWICVVDYEDIRMCCGPLELNSLQKDSKKGLLDAFEEWLWFFFFSLFFFLPCPACRSGFVKPLWTSCREFF